MISTKKGLLSLIILPVLLAGLFLPFKSSEALTLIPPSSEFFAQPGETLSTSIKVFNESNEQTIQYSSTANFTALNETGTPSFSNEADLVDLANWIKMEAGPFTLKPGERIEIPVTIEVPANAEPGGHYAGIFFTDEPPEGTQSGAGDLAISAKLGSLVLVRVDGVIQETANLAEFATSDNSNSFSRPPVDFKVRVQNSGNIHVRPTGNITIRNMLGGTTATLPVNSDQGAVLPTSIRRFDATWDKTGEAKEIGGFFSEIAQEWNNFGLGSYTATLEMKYGLANDKTLTATYKFWIFPWRILLVSLIVIVLVIFLIILFVKRYNQWLIKRVGDQASDKS